jgi:hypothetical protein
MRYEPDNPGISKTTIGLAAWRDSSHIHALSDDERHLGHVIKTDQWEAFDATHSNAAGNGFRYLGSFAGIRTAKEEVERSVARAAVKLARYAGR